ncbi:MAG: amino acid ABC transporter substrate-binding protein [Sphaerochaetaceae bacterium]|nr:amino acid ABC transporter substrate-binding protein [Sphaerochaetaceae bacterium]
MKKLISILMIMLAVTMVLFAGGSKEASDKDLSLKKVQDAGQFILGLDDSFPPMGFRDEKGEIVGFDIDVAKEVCSRLGVKLVPQPIDWAAKEQELATGNIDCIWNGFTITEERLNALTFSDPYVNNAQVAVVRGDSKFNTLADLAGKKVGVQAGSSAQDAIDDTPDFKNSVKSIVEFKDNLTALMDLEIGGVDAVIMDLLVANDNINRSGKNFRVVEEGLSKEEYGVGFRKGDVALRDAVQEKLNEMAKDGSLAKIATKWFGADITVVGKN